MLSILFSCKKEIELVACFSISKSKFILNELINFEDCSLESDNIEWNFGDTHDSGIRNPSHKYNKEGVYEITQTVYDDLNNRKELKRSISVHKVKVSKIEIYRDHFFPNPEFYFHIYFESSISDASYEDNKYIIKNDSIDALPIPNEEIVYLFKTKNKESNLESIYISKKLNIYEHINADDLTLTIDDIYDGIDIIVYFELHE